MSLILTKEQLDFWEQHSYLVLRSFFSDRLELLGEWVDEVASWPDVKSKWLRFYERTNPDQLSRVENFVPYHDGLSEILDGDRIIQLTSQLLGQPTVLYKDRINLKYPGAGPHSAHQDGVAFDQHGSSRFDGSQPPYLSLLVSVDPADESNGCLEVAQDWRLDNLDVLPMESPYTDQPNFSKMSQAAEDDLNWVSICTEPGDAIVFTERIPHRSKANSSDKKRRILYGVYNPAGKGNLREVYFSNKRKDPNNARYMIGNPHARSSPEET